MPMIVQSTYYKMHNIEDFALQVIQSQAFKQQLSKQLRALSETIKIERSEPYDQVSIKQLIHEINGYLTDITESTLQEQNSKNYISFMKNTQEMCSEIQKNASKKVQQMKEDLQEQIVKLKRELQLSNRQLKKTQTSYSRQKQQRKKITKSILDYSVMDNFATTKSTIEHNQVLQNRSNLLSDLQNSRHSSHYSKDLSSSHAQSQALKIKENFEKYDNNIRKWSENLQILKKQMKAQCQNIQKQFGSKMQSNLESIWNVLGDFCTRISKLENMDFSLPLMNQ